MITLTVYRAQTEMEKICGLIGKKNPYPFLLRTRFGIHTFGVRFPIDVLILDNNFVVASYFQEMKPNRVFMWNPKWDIVVELPTGTIASKGIEKGMKIKIVVK